MRCHDRIAFATPAADCRIFCSFGKNVNEIRVVCVCVCGGEESASILGE